MTNLCSAAYAQTTSSSTAWNTGDPVRRAQADGARDEAGLDEQGTVSVHHAARRPDGARGVDDGRRRLRGDGLADSLVLADQIKRCRQRRISVWEVRREPQLHRSVMFMKVADHDRSQFLEVAFLEDCRVKWNRGCEILNVLTIHLGVSGKL